MPVRDRWESITIVGVGLIGGSIGLALKSSGRANRILGVDRNPAHLDLALRAGAIDQAENSLEAAAASADIAVIATHVDRIPDLITRIAHASPAHTLITDAGSTKQTIHTLASLDPSTAARFVPAHPIAGSERKGPEAAQHDLFLNRTCVLTPLPNTPKPVLQEIREFWRAIGCNLLEMDPATHDQAVALTSHLPHALAALLALTVPPDLLPLAAGAYRDGTRVALSDPELWVAVFRQNQPALLAALAQFQNQLDRFVNALHQSNPHALEALWNAARANRSLYQEPPPSPDIAPLPPTPLAKTHSAPTVPGSFTQQPSLIKPS